jgi:putative NADPH-quinone reductase
MAFKYRENSVWWDKLLAGKTAHIITTLDQPSIYYWLVFGRPSVNMLKNSVLGFCGVSPIKVTYIGPIRKSTDAFRAKGIKQAEALGKKLL